MEFRELSLNNLQSLFSLNRNCRLRNVLSVKENLKPGRKEIFVVAQNVGREEDEIFFYYDTPPLNAKKSKEKIRRGSERLKRGEKQVKDRQETLKLKDCLGKKNFSNFWEINAGYVAFQNIRSLSNFIMSMEEKIRIKQKHKKIPEAQILQLKDAFSFVQTVIKNFIWGIRSRKKIF